MALFGQNWPKFGLMREFSVQVLNIFRMNTLMIPLSYSHNKMVSIVEIEIFGPQMSENKGLANFYDLIMP